MTNLLKILNKLCTNVLVSVHLHTLFSLSLSRGSCNIPKSYLRSLRMSRYPFKGANFLITKKRRNIVFRLVLAQKFVYFTRKYTNITFKILRAATTVVVIRAFTCKMFFIVLESSGNQDLSSGQVVIKTQLFL